jgi:putative NIF3 family GTP cyclohydrolase 1 type 2
LKKLTGANYVEQTIIKAIKNDIAIYTAHTNLDNVVNGVNYKIASKLGLQNVEILAPKKGILKKLTTYVPADDAEKVLEALFEAGAGKIGNYSACAFQSEGVGSFLPNNQSNPTVGQVGKKEFVQEKKLELMFPIHAEKAVMKALFMAHPYEEVAYYVQQLDNSNQEVGSGAIGYLPEALDEKVFLALLKDKLSLSCIRYTPFSERKIQKIAVAGGAGSFLLNNAIGANADAFVTGDFKYHEFFDAENKLMIADVGHYESEISTKEIFIELLSEKFTNIVVNFSEINTNPITYYY